DPRRPRRPVPTTKLLQRKLLGPEPSGCLQDRPGAAAGPVAAVGYGCAPPNRAWQNDTASNNRHGWRATSARCRGKPRDTPDHEQVFACGCDSGAAVDTPSPGMQPAQGEMEMVRMACGRNGKTVDPSHQGHHGITARCYALGQKTCPPANLCRITTGKERVSP